MENANFESANGYEQIERPYKAAESYKNGYPYPHWQQDIELLLYKRDGTIICNNEVFYIPAGHICVINPGVVHSIPLVEQEIFLCLIVNHKFCAENGVGYLDKTFDTDISDSYAVELYNSIISHNLSDDEYSEASARAEVLKLMVYLCKNFSNSTKGKACSSGKAVNYIASHFAQKMTLEEIAEHVNMSKYHFCRKFKEETGYSVTEYINFKRCSHAEYLIKKRGYTIKQAAAESGFGNVSYFSRTFKKVMGYLPASCRGADK